MIEPGADIGLYVIILSLKNGGRIRVGALGVKDFPPGAYLYIGSARRGLHARVRRHERRIKPLRWHIDYLRRKSVWEGAVLYPGMLDECALARKIRIETAGEVACKRFGASDCRCEGHLIITSLERERIFEKLKKAGAMAHPFPA